MKKWIIPVLLFLTGSQVCAQQDSVRKLPAIRTTQPIKIDGDLKDEAWKTAAVADKFYEWRPSFGLPEEEKNRTEMYFLYDDEAIYIGGFCHEASRDSISTELVGRDVVGVNDFVGVIFDTYNDKINGFGYYVTALGEQFDAKYSNVGNEDGSWNSVFQSATRIVDGGWIFEMRIPYSAIRFSKKAVQTWGLNITRRRSKSGKQYMWNPVNPNKLGLMNQAGEWTGISNIKPPLRLSFSPYFSTYLNHFPAHTSGVKDWTTSVNGGMDVKYGISKAFTLDMTLIPDFGQVQSDNQVLNLSPFEVKYNEYRTFFTEGTELFNKGDLFYSRRIGGTPLHIGRASQVASQNGHTVVKNPTETKLLNATKISGRTAGGLGIGVFNAITNPTYATLEDGQKNQYEVETNPLTNYSIIVLDQTLKNNSAVSLVNTNVWRSGHDYDANVTAFLWDVYDKQINWNFWGKAATSQQLGFLPGGKTRAGYQYNLNFGKFKGPFNFQVYRHFADDQYDHNDMGYFTNNNYVNYGGWFGYRLVKPKSFYNRLFFNFNWTYSRRFKPNDYQSLFINMNVNGQVKNLASVGLALNLNAEQQDFYEPRKAGKRFQRPGNVQPRAWYFSNEAKKFSYGTEIGHRITRKYNDRRTDIYLSLQYRFNNRLTVSLTPYLEYMKNNPGFAYINGDSVLFGLRDRHTVENILNIKYNFTNRMGLNFRVRHYWSKVEYTRYLNLRDDGYLDPVAGASRNANSNANFFNIDMVYTWQFAQGSFLNIGWKDAGTLFNQEVRETYFKNLDRTLGTRQANNFSVRVIYYLDYLDLKKPKPRNP